jgi:hypothetical protein
MMDFMNSVTFSGMRSMLVVSLIVLFISSVTSCKKEKGGQGSMSSSYNDDRSHNVGTACMDCHNSGGTNKYWWIVAGTVFKPDSTSLASNSTLFLFTGINGTGDRVLTLPVDAKGNFYTTGNVSFGSGLYPEVKSPSGEVRFMQTATTNGNCNGCHTAGHRIIVN